MGKTYRREKDEDRKRRTRFKKDAQLPKKKGKHRDVYLDLYEQRTGTTSDNDESWDSFLDVDE